MILVISKIHKEEPSKSEYGKKFFKIEFVDYYKNEISYITYVSKQNKNYSNWKDFREGDIISNVELKYNNKNIIDADSKPILLDYKKPEQYELFVK